MLSLKKRSAIFERKASKRDRLASRRRWLAFFESTAFPCRPLPSLSLAVPCPCRPLPSLSLAVPCRPFPLPSLAVPFPCRPLPSLSLAVPCRPFPLLSLREKTDRLASRRRWYAVVSLKPSEKRDRRTGDGRLGIFSKKASRAVVSLKPSEEMASFRCEAKETTARLAFKETTAWRRFARGPIFV